MSSKVSDKDRGYARVRANLAKAEHDQVTVGIFAAEGDEIHEGDPLADPVTVLEVATANEFGIGVPERSFIRAWVDQNETLIRRKVKELLGWVVKGKITEPQAMNYLGLWAQGEIQKRISAGIDPPNSPATVARKGSSTPLINTGQLRASITYQIGADHAAD